MYFTRDTVGNLSKGWIKVSEIADAMPEGIECKLKIRESGDWTLQVKVNSKEDLEIVQATLTESTMEDFQWEVYHNIPYRWSEYTSINTSLFVGITFNRPHKGDY